MRSAVCALVMLVMFVLPACGRGDDGAGAIDAAPAIDAVPLPATCNTETQDCPEGYKCTLTGQMAQPPIVRRCVRLQGSVPLGGACTPSGNDLIAFGHDDCAAGLTCKRYGPDGPNVCMRLCTSASACGAGEGCAQFATMNDGLCRKTCEVITAGQCPSGMTCDSYATIGGADVANNYCRPIGPVPQGSPCFVDGECGLNQGCGPDFNCGPICNEAHPCAVGDCELSPVQPDFGVCTMPL